MDVISCVQQHMAICSCQGRQRQHTDLAVSPSPDLVSGISYLWLCMYHRHLDSFKASWRQYFFARPTRHDSARSWLLRLLELRLTNFPTYLLTYNQSQLDIHPSLKFLSLHTVTDGHSLGCSSPLAASNILLIFFSVVLVFFCLVLHVSQLFSCGIQHLA